MYIRVFIPFFLYLLKCSFVSIEDHIFGVLILFTLFLFFLVIYSFSALLCNMNSIILKVFQIQGKMSGLVWFPDTSLPGCSSFNVLPESCAVFTQLHQYQPMLLARVHSPFTFPSFLIMSFAAPPISEAVAYFIILSP